MKTILSCDGRLIGPKDGEFPNWHEIFYGLKELSVFNGQGNDSQDWNYLKHSVLVGLLCYMEDENNFLKGLLYNWPRIFIGNVQRRFKFANTRKFEKLCRGEMKMHLQDVWEGFNVRVYDRFNCSPAEKLVVDIEAEWVMNCPPEHYKIYYYEPSALLGFDKKDAHKIFKKLVTYPTKKLFKLTKVVTHAICQGNNSGSRTVERFKDKILLHSK